MPERGVLYMASGEQYINEAIRSAESVKEHTGLPTAIATDDTIESDVFDRVIEYECEIMTVDGRDWLLNSTILPDLSPYEKTLYLDSDTLLRADVTEVFDLLDSFDLAIARTPSKPPVDGLPDTWSLLNCGVIAYRDCTTVNNLLQDWRERYRTQLQETTNPKDQPTFAKALYVSDVDWYCLPREYNVRLPRRGFVSGKLKIVHGRHPAGLETMAQELEQSTRPRIYREQSIWGTPTHTVSDRGKLRYHAESTLSNHGIGTLAKVGIDFVLDKLLGTNRMDEHREIDIG